jgi:hypothetical protein
MSLPSGEAIVEFVDRWFEERSVELRCPACHRSCWRPSQYTISPWASADGQLVEMFYMFLPVCCQHCGFVVFFNAMTMSGDGPKYYPEQITEAGSEDQPM